MQMWKLCTLKDLDLSSLALWGFFWAEIFSFLVHTTGPILSTFCLKDSIISSLLDGRRYVFHPLTWLTCLKCRSSLRSTYVPTLKDRLFHFWRAPIIRNYHEKNSDSGILGHWGRSLPITFILSLHLFI